MELPPGIRQLVDALEERGFSIISDEAWPERGARHIELRARRRGVRRVRIEADRGLWTVEVGVGREWHDPHTAVAALDAEPHQQRALGHEERVEATLKLVARGALGTGDRRRMEARRRLVREGRLGS